MQSKTIGKIRTASPAGAIIDLDGTVYRGDKLLPGAAEGIRALREAGVNILFVSNKAIGRPISYSRKLRELGIPCDPTDVVTSAAVTASWLGQNYPDGAAFVVGEEPLVAELREVGVEVTTDPEDADVVVASLDRSFEYRTLTDLLVALDEETPYVTTNPDRTCPVDGGEIPGAGATIGAIEGLTGRRPDIVAGKPSATMATVATQKVGHDPTECLVLGDRLDTDIEMGNRAGMETVLVLTGVTDHDVLAASPIQPDHVLEDLRDIPMLLG